MSNNNFLNVIAQQVDKLVNERLKKAPFNKTYNGIISDILFDPDTDIKDYKFGTYLVRYGSTEKKIKITDGLVHSIGEKVKVYVERNDPNNVSVEPMVKRILPKVITYKKGSESGEGSIDNDFITELREVKINGKTYKTESVFKVEVKNRDTETEEVTKMIFPNGEEVEFKGWDI